MLTKADRLLGEYASMHDGVFTLADASECGLTATQIRRRSVEYWIRLHEGVFRMPGAVSTWNGDLRAACLAARAPVGVAGAAAGALYDLYFGREVVDIMCQRWGRTKSSGIIVHESTRFDADDLTEVQDLPVVKPEFLIMQMAGRKPSVNEVERMFHAARRKRLITHDSMRETFDRLARRGLPGVKATREALERWDPNSRPTESEMETWLLQILRRHGLPEPSLQFIVLDEFGNFVARTDAAIPHWRITVEYQSIQEHSDEFQAARDDHRRNKIIRAGYLPIHARYDDLRSGGAELVADIRAAARTWGS